MLLELNIRGVHRWQQTAQMPHSTEQPSALWPFRWVCSCCGFCSSSAVGGMQRFALSGLRPAYPRRLKRQAKTSSPLACAKPISWLAPYPPFSVLPIIASVAKSGPNLSPLSIPRRLASLMRARLTRLLTVPTAQ